MRNDPHPTLDLSAFDGVEIDEGVTIIGSLHWDEEKGRYLATADYRGRLVVLGLTIRPKALH